MKKYYDMFLNIYNHRELIFIVDNLAGIICSSNEFFLTRNNPVKLLHHKIFKNYNSAQKIAPIKNIENTDKKTLLFPSSIDKENLRKSSRAILNLTMPTTTPNKSIRKKITHSQSILKTKKRTDSQDSFAARSNNNIKITPNKISVSKFDSIIDYSSLPALIFSKKFHENIIENQHNPFYLDEILNNDENYALLKKLSLNFDNLKDFINI